MTMANCNNKWQWQQQMAMAMANSNGNSKWQWQMVDGNGSGKWQWHGRICVLNKGLDVANGRRPQGQVGLLTGAPTGIPGPDLQVIWIPKVIPGPVKLPVNRYLYLQVKYLDRKSVV